MMAKQEYQFCETKGKYITFLNPMAIVETLKAKPRLSFVNILNAFFVAKECIKGRSDSWVIYTRFQENPIAKTIPLTKRQLSKKSAKLMADYYQDSADDDLVLAKEFEEIEPQVDGDQ